MTEKQIHGILTIHEKQVNEGSMTVYEMFNVVEFYQRYSRNDKKSFYTGKSNDLRT